METTDISEVPNCITADSFGVNVKEETPGVILSNVDLVTPVYSLVPTIKLEPESENIVEKVVDSKIITADASVFEGSFSDTDEIEIKKGFTETSFNQETVSPELASLINAEKLSADLIERTEVLDACFEKIPKFHMEESEHSSFKAASSETNAPQFEARDEGKYPKLSDISKLNSETVQSISDKHVRVTDLLKKEPGYIDDVIADSSGENPPVEMIVGNCEAPLLTSVFETIVSNCDLPLLGNKNNLNSLIPEEFESPSEWETGSRFTNSQRINTSFTVLLNKKCKATQSKEVVKEHLLKEKKQTSKVYSDSTNILDLPASKHVLRLSNWQRKQLFESPSKSTKTLRSLDASLDEIVLSTSMCSPEKETKSSLTPGGYPKPIIVSNEEWKRTPERFIHRLYKFNGLEKKYRKHTSFPNDEWTVETVKIFSISETEKMVSQRVKLYFIKDKGWACEKCEQIFQKSHQLQNHKKSCYVDGISCKLCPRVFNAIGAFRAHKIYCQKPVYKCPKCPRIFYMTSRYEHHYSIHHEKAYICIECSPPKNFNNKIILRRHMTRWHVEPNVTCKACGQILRRTQIKKHMRVHDRKKLVCMLCGLHFTAQTSLWKHWKTHNDTGNPAAVVCKCCGKFFERKTELRKHLKEHESERTFVCENCGKSFFTATNLFTHLITHKEKQFICPKCKRGFVHKHQLTAHLGTIACGGNAFPNNKVSSVKTSKEESRSVPKNRYICANCEKGFISKRLLITHLSTESCSENAPSRSESMKNLKRKPGKKTKLSPSAKTQFTCANCDEKFVRKPQLVAHLSSAPCRSDISASKKVIEFRNDNIEESRRLPKEQFITVFENFVHKRQLAVRCGSVTSSGNVIFSEEKVKVRSKAKKGKKNKLKPLSINRCRNCGYCCIRKEQLTTHICTAPHGGKSLPLLEMAATKKEAKKSRSKPKKQFSCANCNQNFLFKRKLATHILTGACNSDAELLLKQTEEIFKEKEVKKKESAVSLADEWFVCESCSQGFADRQQLNDHWCTAAGSSSALSSSIEEKRVVERKVMKKKKLCSVPKEQLVHKINSVPEQKLSRTRRSAALSSSKKK